MSAPKKLFKTPSSSDSTSSKNKKQSDEQKLSSGNVSKKKKKPCSSKKLVRSLTDAEYEDIFTAVLSQPAEDAEKSEDSESAIEEQHIPAIIPDDLLDENISALRSAQILNEATPPASDTEDAVLKPPSSPVKKKKRFIHKESVNRKQLLYPCKEKQHGPKSLPLYPKKKHCETKTTKDKLLELQIKRINDNDGTWVQCCRPECSKWRYLDHVKEPFEIPSEWYCAMNKDSERNSCDKPETDYSELEFVFTKFAAGSIVWAKLQGFPWWPAMVDDDPTIGEYFWTNGFSDIPSHYNVVFLDDIVSRAWILKSCIKPFKEETVYSMLNLKGNKYQKALEAAVKNAITASNLSLKDRLMQFSFAAKYTGKWPKLHCNGKENNHNTSVKEVKSTSQKQISRDKLTHDEGLSDAEEILNQLEELDDFESISSLLDFGSENEDDFIPPSQNRGVVPKSKRPATLKSKIKPDGAKKLCCPTNKNISNNHMTTKKHQSNSLLKKKTTVHSFEKISKSFSKKPLSNSIKTSSNEEKHKTKAKAVKKPKFSVASQNQLEKTEVSISSDSRDGQAENETESISQLSKNRVAKMPANKNSPMEKLSRKDNQIEITEKTKGKAKQCQVKEITKVKRKPSFRPPKVSKVSPTMKEKSDSQTMENVLEPQTFKRKEEIEETQETCDITSSPMFEDSPSESQKSVPFETEE